MFGDAASTEGRRKESKKSGKRTCDLPENPERAGAGTNGSDATFASVSVPITRRGNSGGACWYSENDTPYLPGRKERATQNGKRVRRRRELSGKKRTSSRCHGLNGLRGNGGRYGG